MLKVGLVMLKLGSAMVKVGLMMLKVGLCRFGVSAVASRWGRNVLLPKSLIRPDACSLFPS